VEPAPDPIRALEELDGPLGAPPNRLVGNKRAGSPSSDDGQIEHALVAESWPR